MEQDARRYCRIEPTMALREKTYRTSGLLSRFDRKTD